MVPKVVTWGQLISLVRAKNVGLGFMTKDQFKKCRALRQLENLTELAEYKGTVNPSLFSLVQCISQIKPDIVEYRSSGRCALYFAVLSQNI